MFGKSVNQSGNCQSSKVLLRVVALTAIALSASSGKASSEQASLTEGSGQAVAAAGRCDDSLKTSFNPDSNTSVLLVREFRKGEPLLLQGSPNQRTVFAQSDLCVVKLNVGPGHPGPADAPSTSPGIGIEIWLPTPAKWNGRLHLVGGGGWAGGAAGSSTSLAGTFGAATQSPATIASVEGAVSATTDTGHADYLHGGAFAMKVDGTINRSLWTDFASRSIHEMAVKTKALADLYYGKPARYSYFDGFSTGGRQGMKEAQAHPADFDGILSGAPAFNWSKFITAELYPQIVFQRDLGGVAVTPEQQDLVSNAAIAACDVVAGTHLGFILDPSKCRYDPLADKSVLCVSEAGTNASTACVTRIQATAINKIWYGMTSDGSVPSPAMDNGWAGTGSAGPTMPQRWFGPARGTSLYAKAFASLGINGLASPRGSFGAASDQVALELQDPALGDPAFVNAMGNGRSGWKTLSYKQLSNAFDRGVALQLEFGSINSDHPDLSGFKARKGKMLHYHGLADELIMPQGSVQYYNRVLTSMNGLAEVRPFYRLFLIPGFGHGSPNGTSNPTANNPAPSPGQLYNALTQWVEKGVAPDKIVLNSPPAGSLTRSLPICAYPNKISYITGDPNVETSYTCSQADLHGE